MRIQGAGLVLAGTLGLTAMVGGVVLGPAVATAATTEESAGQAVGNRVERIKEALQGLVEDDTLTEEQRDRVATTLDEQLPPGRGHGPGKGGHGRGHGKGGRIALDAAATTLGMTEEELVAQLRDGRSLADLAAEKGVAVEDLAAALTAAAEERLAEKVAEGELTQEEADAKKAELAERIAAAIEREGFPGRGHGPGGRPGAPEDEVEAPAEEPAAEGSSFQPA